MTQINNIKRVIIISLVAVLVITGVILYLSISGADNGDKVVLSDSIPGKNNSDIKKELTAEEIEGYYIDNSDGWYYDFIYAPDGKYDGSFSAGYDQNHTSVADNPQKHFTAAGKWTLDKGEIKLYNDTEYQQSMWACGNYIVDSQNFFEGKLPKDKDKFDAVFTCKAMESGDTQILNFYEDGKMIMEIIRNDGETDSSSSTSLPPYQLVAGTYTLDSGKLTTVINGASQEFYISDDGLAKWIYNKK